MREPKDESIWIDQLALATSALAEVTPRFGTLLRSVRDPNAAAIGDWSSAEVAAHMSHACAGDLMVARSLGDPVDYDFRPDEDIISAAASFNAATLGSDSERDMPALADRIEAGAADFLAALDGAKGYEPVTWLGGVVLPIAAPACHLLEEMLVHGYDIARAEKKPWPIAPAHAALGFGFVLDVLRLATPEMRRFFVHQDAAAGVRVCFDFKMRGARRDYLVFEDGLITVEDPSSRRVDCHISADPVAALLAGMGRLGPARAALGGRILAWGRKPWLAFRLGTLLRNP